VVAERRGYPPGTDLTLGRFAAGSGAGATARRLGIIAETHESKERRVRTAALKPWRQKADRLGRDVGRLFGRYRFCGIRPMFCSLAD